MKLSTSIAHCRVWRYLLLCSALSLISLTFLAWQLRGGSEKGSSQTLSPQKMQEISMRMAARLDRLNDRCSGYVDDGRPRFTEILVNKKYHIIWCPVFKAASTSWMFNFNVLAGYDPTFLRETKKIAASLALMRYPDVSLQELRAAQNDSITFMIVRNPMERLLSAYRDKMLFPMSNSYYSKISRSIVLNYRKKLSLSGRAGNQNHPSFPEFVHWLLDHIKSGRIIDVHFVAIVSHCRLCERRYDMILKFESLAEEQLYLIEKTGLKHLIGSEWINEGKGKGNAKTHDLQQQFYSQLTRHEIMLLYDYYQFDYALFGYDIKDHLKYARTDAGEDAAAALGE